jgi:hypothetical protein
MELLAVKKLLNPIAISILSALSLHAYAEPQKSVYNLICESNTCNAVDTVSKYINNETIKFKSSDMFYIYDSNIVVDSITYSDYRNSVSRAKFKSPPMRLKDSSLDCNFDADYSCNDWSGNNDTTNIVNYLQNFTYRSQPLSTLEIEIRNKLKQIGNTIAVSSVLALTLHKVGGKILTAVVIETGSRRLGIIVRAAITGSASTIAGFVLSGETDFKAGDVLIFKGGKLHSIIRNGVEIPESQIGNSTSVGGGIGGVGGSSGGGNGSGGFVGGGGSGGGGSGGYCFNCGVFYIKDMN